MSWKKYNPNPLGIDTGDCVPRALSIVLNCSWDEAFAKLCVYAFMYKRMPSKNFIHDSLLKDMGFERFTACSGCFTVKSFSEQYNKGTYLLGTGDHVVGVISGNYYDSWDSGSQEIIWIYERKD